VVDAGSVVADAGSVMGAVVVEVTAIIFSRSSDTQIYCRAIHH
jgi:hypothetical protein